MSPTELVFQSHGLLYQSDSCYVWFWINWFRILCMGWQDVSYVISKYLYTLFSYVWSAICNVQSIIVSGWLPAKYITVDLEVIIKHINNWFK